MSYLFYFFAWARSLEGIFNKVAEQNAFVDVNAYSSLSPVFGIYPLNNNMLGVSYKNRHSIETSSMRADFCFWLFKQEKKCFLEKAWNHIFFVFGLGSKYLL